MRTAVRSFGEGITFKREGPEFSQKKKDKNLPGNSRY
jgi:hypothetical protein